MHCIYGIDLHSYNKYWKLNKEFSVLRRRLHTDAVVECNLLYLCNLIHTFSPGETHSSAFILFNDLSQQIKKEQTQMAVQPHQVTTPVPAHAYISIKYTPFHKMLRGWQHWQSKEWKDSCLRKCLRKRMAVNNPGYADCSCYLHRVILWLHSMWGKWISCPFWAFY